MKYFKILAVVFCVGTLFGCKKTNNNDPTVNMEDNSSMKITVPVAPSLPTSLPNILPASLPASLPAVPSTLPASLPANGESNPTSIPSW